MNSYVLMAKIVNKPELRYTTDTQQAFTTMMVEHTTQQTNQEQKFTLKVTAKGNLSTDLSENYRQGDMVILVGRLSMNVYETGDGYKEKRAEINLSHIYPAGGEQSYTPAAQTSDRMMASNSLQQKTTTEPAQPSRTYYAEEQSVVASSSQTLTKTPTDTPSANEEDLDDIPF